MEEVTGATLAIIGALLFVLVSGAAWLAYTGLRTRAESRDALRENSRLHALLLGAPALAATVRPDGRVDMPRRMADWFGAAGDPEYLGDLDVGLEAEDCMPLVFAGG